VLPHFVAPGREAGEGVPGVPMGTTVLALRYQTGIVIAGDRQATEGYQVASRRIEKVYAADEHSAVAIAGAAGPCIEMVRLFQTELAHYEKIEGMNLSLEGKANRLAQMVHNLPPAGNGGGAHLHGLRPSEAKVALHLMSPRAIQRRFAPHGSGGGMRGQPEKLCGHLRTTRSACTGGARRAADGTGRAARLHWAFSPR
jgi:hypothetical protein